MPDDNDEEWDVDSIAEAVEKLVLVVNFHANLLTEITRTLTALGIKLGPVIDPTGNPDETKH